jgi:hypothetical protein
LLSFLRRFKQKQQEKAPSEAAAPTVEPVPQPPADGGPDTTKPKRRRGTRGGRGRRKTGEPATPEPTAKTAKGATPKAAAKAPATPAKPERKPSERRAEGERRGTRARERRRRIQPKRGALPTAKRELLVSVAALDVFALVVAVASFVALQRLKVPIYVMVPIGAIVGMVWTLYVT